MLLLAHARTLFAAAALAALLPLAPAWSGTNGGLSSLSGNYLAGRYAGKQRDMDVAADYFAKALREDPANAVLAERAFVHELSAGNIVRAEQLAEQVAASNDSHRVVQVVLGLKNFRAGQHRAARVQFKKAAFTPVGELTAALLTAWSFAAENDSKDALQALEALSKTDSFAPYKAFHGALIADLLGVPARAGALYRKAYESAGTSPRVLIAFASYLARTGDAPEARKVFRTFLDGNPDHPLIGEALRELDAGKPAKRFLANARAGAGEALFSLASALSDDQGIEVALIYAQLALSLRPDFAEAQALLGDIYEAIGRHQLAVDAYAKVPATSALRANAEIRAAVNLDKVGQTPEAIHAFERLLAREPKHYDALMSFGNMLRGHSKFAEAATSYGRAIETLGTPLKRHWQAFYFRGICHERTKQWPAAEADFKKALELEANQPLVLNYLGYSWIEQRLNLREAMDMIRKAVELRPNDGYIIDSLGWAHYQLGQYEDAVRELERAVEIKPDDPTINDHLGDAYWYVGRRLEARFQWQHARDSKPEPQDLVKIEQKLRDGLPEGEPANTEHAAPEPKKS